MVCVERIIVASTCFESSNNDGEGGGGGGDTIITGGGGDVFENEIEVDSFLAKPKRVNEGEELTDSVSGSASTSNSSSSSSTNNNKTTKKKKKGVVTSSTSDTMMMMVECRICQEEDHLLSLESPCACNGSLKFAHRKCIQRWCNKKGDITCEICNQVFSPNYSAPPIRSNPDVMAIDIRQLLGQHIDLRDPHLLALAAAEQQLLQSEYEDCVSTSSIACLRTLALILLIIMLLRQVLVVTRDAGIVQESPAFFSFQVSLLQLVGFLLPCCVMAHTWYVAQCRRRRLLG